jgi:ATP-dependent DNA helicase HFM1/MER3
LNDIGEWLKCHNGTVHDFDQTYRPVPLQIKTISYPNMSNPFLFERSLEGKVKDVIQRFSDHKQTIVFCSSKKNAENQASKLLFQGLLSYKEPSETLNLEIMKLQDENLRNLASQGYGYHHSGLYPDDRMIVERLFLSGFISVLCSTSTLAQGMNFPAHLVVIKGTHSWRGSEKGYQKLSRSDVIQMLGRAGRPGFDLSGKAVIMTSKEDEAYYSGISLTADLVESKLQNLLLEAVAAEISQSTITSLDDCVNWIKSTLYYIRLKKALSEKLSTDIATLYQYLEQEINDISLKALESLHEQQLIEYDTQNEIVVPCEEVHIMSRNLTRFMSMILLMKISKTADIMQILYALSDCEEIHKPLRRSDKASSRYYFSVVFL